MTGDFTSVALRDDERWIAARMQQGRVLLDTDWNLNLDGPARDAQALALDTIGPAGVPVGGGGFEISYQNNTLTIGAGEMWVGGMLARNPTPIAYTDQAEIAALPASGLVQFYLDVFREEVQAAEDAGLLDPALDGVDTTTRTRIGWRVRAVEATAPACSAAGLPATGSTGLLDVVRTSAPVPADPCAPPDDPRVKLPDGLLRIEVLDAGDEKTARFAWSFADGADAVAATVAGTAVQLAPSPAVTFAPGDLVEVSTLARRADRRDHGPLFDVAAVSPQAGGDQVTLGAPSALAGNPPGTCLRRWDGETVGAATPVTATLGGADAGIAFTASPGRYEVGDWWGVRVRGSAADAVEIRTAAPADGTRHAFGLLAVTDLGKQQVLTDCRPKFPPLTELRGGTCTVTAFPGDDLQAALDRLPDTGGELCLAAGTYPVTAPLQVTRRRRVVVTGVGPATVLQAAGHEAVVQAVLCSDITVTSLRVEAGRPRDPGASGEEHLLGALTFLGCDGVTVSGCEISCPDSAGRAQSGIYLAPGPDGQLPDDVEIRGNSLECGDQQVGMLVVSAGAVTIADNIVELAAGPAVKQPARPTRLVAAQLGRYIAGHLLAEKVAGGRTVELPGATTVHVGGSTQVKRLATEWGKVATAGALAKAGGPDAALQRFATSAVLEPHQAGLSKASLGFLFDSIGGSRSIGQGIVVAGERADLVRIEGNTIRGAVQGVHVGVGGAHGDARTAGQVVISGNTVANLVPFFWDRQRHAIYVGSSASTTMTDNHATLSRTTLLRLADLRATPVEAVRVWGRLGRYLQIRGMDLSGGYAVGVHIEDTGDPKQGPRIALRHVSDVLNADGGRALLAPQEVQFERCLP